MHVTTLKRIGRYLLKASGKGIILSPSSEIAIDCYVDEDFAGLWNWEDQDDENFVKSRKGYVICIGELVTSQCCGLHVFKMELLCVQ